MKTIFKITSATQTNLPSSLTLLLDITGGKMQWLSKILPDIFLTSNEEKLPSIMFNKTYLFNKFRY